MNEYAFKLMINKGFVSNVEICESTPIKGKAALKADTTTSVWVIKITLNDGTFELLESYRGGAREWASLDRLNNWLRNLGLKKYDVNLIKRSEYNHQPELIFGENR